MMKIAMTRMAHKKESVQENLNARVRVGELLVVVMWVGVKQRAGVYDAGSLLFLYRFARSAVRRELENDVALSCLDVSRVLVQDDRNPLCTAVTEVIT